MITSKAERDFRIYREMRSEGRSHEDAVAMYRRCGIDIEHTLKLSPMQRRFGERWFGNAVLATLLCAAIGALSWYLQTISL